MRPLGIEILNGLYCVIIFTLTENNHFEGGVVNVKKHVILMGESELTLQISKSCTYHRSTVLYYVEDT